MCLRDDEGFINFSELIIDIFYQGSMFVVGGCGKLILLLL
jgi:hypothetical protein